MSSATPVRSSLEPYAVHPVQQYLIDAAEKWPSKIAVIDGDRRFTFGEMNAHSDRFAAALADMGVKKGDRVLFSSYAGTEVKIEGTEYLIMTEDDILGIID